MHERQGEDWRRWRIGALAVAAAVVVGLVVGVVVLDRSDDNVGDAADGSGPVDEEFVAFCDAAEDERDALADAQGERATALERLAPSAPEDFVVVVEDAAGSVDSALPEDLFVVPGDANSAVRADVAARMWDEEVTVTRARDRVEQVLVHECGLTLADGDEIDDDLEVDD